MRGFSQDAGGRPFFSASSTCQPITMFRSRYPFSTIASQKSTEFGVGYSITFTARIGCPRSTKINRMHMVTEDTARNSPKMVILPNAL